MSDIVKAGLLVIRDGRILLCRKNRDTALFITPGGRLEPGETEDECIVREVAEELGPDVAVSELHYIGTYRDVAAGQEDRMVEVRLYRGNLQGDPAPHSEIAELIWFEPGSDTGGLSATLRNHIVPDLIARGLLDPLRMYDHYAGL
ncbi:MAG: NUDIX domain-containing protein [Bryobacteraceae bacterium]|nr:NUDIX domain-containing protein [Bryobacteraceae bacterium]